jgi:hypothetical protein
MMGGTRTVLGRERQTGFGDMPSIAAVREMQSAGDLGIGAGNMRLPWNMPTGILFLTTRSPRIAAFLSGTGNYKLSEIHDYACSSYHVGTKDAGRTASGRRRPQAT